MSNKISILINGTPLDISEGNFECDLNFHAKDEYGLRLAIDAILRIPGDRADYDEVESSGATVWFRNDLVMANDNNISLTVFGYDGLTKRELRAIVQEVAQLSPRPRTIEVDEVDLNNMRRQIDYTYEVADGDSNDEEIGALQRARDMLAETIGYTPKEAS